MSLESLYRITPGGSLPIVVQTVTIDDITRQLPTGFYTTFRTFGNRKRAIGLKAHLNRLYKPAADQNIHPAVQPAELTFQLRKILQDQRNEVRVRLILTHQGDMYIVLSPLQQLSPEVYQRGVSVITTDVQREKPRIKSTSFITSSQDTREHLHENKIFEALLKQEDFILEGMTSNFFYIHNGILGTARYKILLGVTRKTVLRLARGRGLEILYRPLSQEQIPIISEAFITSSSRGIVPISKIDNEPVGEGVPGPMTRLLTMAYNEYVMQHAELI